VESIVYDPGGAIGSSDVHCRECVRVYKLGTFLGRCALGLPVRCEYLHSCGERVGKGVVTLHLEGAFSLRRVVEIRRLAQRCGDREDHVPRGEGEVSRGLDLNVKSNCRWLEMAGVVC
jgi:hypothetical protein